MNRAKVKGSNPANPTIVFAGAVNPDNPSVEKYVCPYALCVGEHETDVHYLPRITFDGDLHERVAHFATVAGQAERHHPDCNLKYDFENSAEHRSLRKGLEQGKIPLINLNLGGPVTRSRGQSDYSKWREGHKGKFVAVSVRDAETCDLVVQTIVKYANAEQYQNAMVGYRGYIFPFTKFNAGDDMLGILADLANRKSVMYSYKGFANAQPRWVKLDPSPTARQRGANDMISMSPVFGLQDNVQIKLFPLFFLRGSASQGNLLVDVLKGHNTRAIVLPSQGEGKLSDYRRDFIGAAHNSTPGHHVQVATNLRLTIFSADHVLIVPPVPVTLAAENTIAVAAKKGPKTDGLSTDFFDDDATQAAHVRDHGGNAAMRISNSTKKSEPVDGPPIKLSRRRGTGRVDDGQMDFFPSASNDL